MSTVHEAPHTFKQHARWQGTANGADHTGSETLTAALYYHDHGCFIVPCCTMTTEGQCTYPYPHTHTTEKSIGKVPLPGKGWQHTRLTRADIIHQWTQHPTANVGVLLEPSGLLVADFDSQEATEEASKYGLPPGPQVRTGRGVQHYFRNPKNIIGLAIRKGESRSIDVLSKGIVVGFGSIHRTGKRYELLTSWEEWPVEDPPLWAEQLLLDSLKNQSAAADIADNLPPVDLEALQIPRWLHDVILHGQPKHHEKYPSRSEAVWAVITSLVEAGHDNNTIASILLDPRYQISAKPREQGARWIAGEIGRARAKTHTKPGNGNDSVPPETDWSDAEANAHYTEQERPLDDDPPETDWSDATHEHAETTGLPRIIVNNQHLRDLLDESLAALRERNTPPVLFERASVLVKVQRDERNQPFLCPVSESVLRESLTRSADFMKIAERKGAQTIIRVSPPRDVVQTMHARGSWHLPALIGLCECPVLRPDGTVVERPGYDEATRLFYDPAPGLSMAALSATPTQAHAQEAAQLLFSELLGDFPFCEPADKANMLACILTPIVRPAIKGCVPLCLIDKPGPGSGATLLSDVVATITTGLHAAKEMMPAGRNSEEEMRKRITSLLMAAKDVVVLDNIENALTSSALSAVLTTPLWQDRVLSKNEMITLPVRTTWIATANNIAIRGDIGRRSYRVRIDPKQDRPWTRDTFKHADLLAWTREHRGELLHALLTMARAWFATGKPKPQGKLPKIGGFEEWVSIIGSILAYAGVQGFLENLEELYAMVDEDAQQWRVFIATWHEQLGEQPVTVAEFTGFAQANPVLMETLPDVIDWDSEKFDSSKKKLGKALKKRIDRYFGEYRLEQGKSDTDAKVSRWRVKKYGVYGV